MIDPDVALTYLDFVVERHRVWERRQAEPGPWTDDPILRSYKFTNVFRVLDHGSQFLVRELLTSDLEPRDALMRCFLYRYTNLPATWIDLRDGLMRYPLERDLGAVENRLKMRRDAGYKVFSGAYVILPQPNIKGDKVQQAVALTARWMAKHADDFLAADTQQQRYDILRREYGVGPFLAMQILTDWGYSPQVGEDRENEFIIPGPGCIKGAKFIDPAARPEATLEWAVEQVAEYPGCPTLSLDDYGEWFRQPSLMDIQNTLCEYSKYHRHATKPDRVVPYAPAHPGPQPPPVLPQHW